MPVHTDVLMVQLSSVTASIGLVFSHEVKPVLIGLTGMFVGAYLQGVLAEGRPKLQG